MNHIIISDDVLYHRSFIIKCGQQWRGSVSGVCELAVAVSYVIDDEPVFKNILNPDIDWVQRVDDLASEVLHVGQECSP